MEYKLKTFLLLMFITSCFSGSNYSVKGTVQRIETGKDGYMAIVITENGDSIEATISRVDMGWRYKELEVGDKIKIYGDSLRSGHGISITATKIVE